MGSPGNSPPDRTICASAPTRICDLGGWTDTWFAGHGKVLNIGVSPLVEVRVAVSRLGTTRDRVALEARNVDERYAFDPHHPPGRQPLLEAITTEIGVPDDLAVSIVVSSTAPPGSSTGTSAATAVALIGALDFLTPGRMTADEVAARAHRIEVDRLRLQSGVQDQLCAAYGGISFIEISPYPHASVSQVRLAEPAWSDLERRLLVMYLGRPHVSSDVHDQVVAALGGIGGHSSHLEVLRQAAQDAKDALERTDFAALGRAMIRNTDAQRYLHGELVSPIAEEVIRRAAAHGALGWKVNGAGGRGGSLTILCGPDAARMPSLLRDLSLADPGVRRIPIRLSRGGLRVWEV